MRSARYRINKPVKQIGLISDSHGLLRPEIAFALNGVDLIIHGGDIGKPEVLDGLREIAPVYAIKGNNDREGWARKIPDVMTVTIGKLKLYVIHAVQDLDIDAAAAGFRAVVSGHSHKPSAVKRDGVLYINPGSAGPRRFKLPVAVAKLHVAADGVIPELIDVFTGEALLVSNEQRKAESG
ncbi:MAG: metallophosphoesterase family protein [Candidatus Binatia bacterium]